MYKCRKGYPRWPLVITALKMQYEVLIAAE